MVKRQVGTPWRVLRRFLSSFLDSFSLPNGKRSTIKTFPELNLVSLILRAHTLSKSF